MPRRGSKVGIIAAYVAKHPDATWKEAEASLKKRGISSNYFATQRSKLKSAESGSGEAVADGSGKSTTKKSTAKVTGKRGRPARSAVAKGAGADLQSAADFARKAGGLPEAKALLDELSKFQVK